MGDAVPSPLSTTDKQLIEKALNEIRITSSAVWSPGYCQMTKVNKFDSFGKAGIRERDIVYAIDGEALTDETAFLLTLGRLGVGAKPVFRVRRGNQDLDITVELLKRRELRFDIDEQQVDLERKIAPA